MQPLLPLCVCIYMHMCVRTCVRGASCGGREGRDRSHEVLQQPVQRHSLCRGTARQGLPRERLGEESSLEADSYRNEPSKRPRLISHSSSVALENVARSRFLTSAKVSKARRRSPEPCPYTVRQSA